MPFGRCFGHLWKLSSDNTSFLFIHKHIFDSSGHLNGQVLCLNFCLESHLLYQEDGALWRRSPDLKKGKYLREMEAGGNIKEESQSSMCLLVS